MKRKHITARKILTMSELAKLSGMLRRRKKIVATNGVFDILHAGHVRYLEAAKGLGDVLVVGLNSDGSVRKNKGNKRPINTEAERAEVLAGLGCVDYVCIFASALPLDFLEALRPHIHVKGGDYSPDELPERRIVEGNGGRVVVLPYEKGFSTTGTIERIIKKYCK